MYKQGDKVILIKQKSMPDEWASEMMKYMGKVVTISRVNGDHFYIVESIAKDNRDWSFRIPQIARFEDDGLDAIRIQEIKEKIAKIKEECIYKIEDIETMASEIFGMDRIMVRKKEWVNPDEDLQNFTIDIHFPEFEIRNSKGRKHTIKDLYFRVNCEFRDLFKSPDTMKASIYVSGMRSTHFTKEFSAGYRHSHLPSSSYGQFSGFCLGSSNFRILLSNLSISLSHSDWYLMFLSIESYLKWESLEGGPHVRMENMTRETRISSDAISAEAERLLKGIPKEAFGYNEGVKLIPSHEALLEYYDKNCTIREIVSKRTSPTLTKSQMDSYLSSMRGGLNGYKFNDRVVEPIILESKSEITKKDAIKPIDAAVIESLNTTIEQKTILFNKKLIYEQAKHNANTFREVSPI